jgi:hypothetical protein
MDYFLGVDNGKRRWIRFVKYVWRSSWFPLRLVRVRIGNVYLNILAGEVVEVLDFNGVIFNGKYKKDWTGKF